MRINRFIALATGMSRRAADNTINRVTINGTPATSGSQVEQNDVVKLDGHVLHVPTETTTIMLHKPVGYVCSRDGQGSKTIYELLPNNLHHLKPIGRLDKDSSGLLLLTNDGKLAHELTHPSFQKDKVYEVTLDKPLTSEAQHQLEQGVMLDDGISQLRVQSHPAPNSSHRPTYEVRMREGRNRQIRRTFDALGYHVHSLHRTQFGSYKIAEAAGEWRLIT